MQVEILNPNAARIDIGSRSHFAAIGDKKHQVREFGVYSEDHQQLIQWFTENGIKTVAMESTRTYWQNLLSVLQEAGFKVILANGKFTKKHQREKDRCIRLPMDSKTSFSSTIKWKFFT